MPFLDRTKEFRNYSGCNEILIEPIYTINAFTKKALDIVQQCIDYEHDIDYYVLSTSSLDSLISPFNAQYPLDNHVTEREATQKMAKSPSLLKTEMQHIRDEIKALGDSLNSSKNNPHDFEAHQHGILSYLYERLMKGTIKFKSAEESRLQRENKLQRVFNSDYVVLGSPIKPLWVSILPMEEQFSYLSPKWKRVVQKELNNQTDKSLIKTFTEMSQTKLSDAESTIDLKGLHKNSTLVLEKPKSPLTLLSHNSTNSMHHNDIPDELETKLFCETQQLVTEQETLLAEQSPYRTILQTFAEIQTMIDFFSLEVAHQSEMCEHIHTTAIESVQTIVGATNELKKTEERKSSYRYYIILFYIICSFILLFADFFTSSRWY